MESNKDRAQHPEHEQHPETPAAGREQRDHGHERHHEAKADRNQPGNAKFGFPRDPHDADRATAAQEFNNADPRPLELLDGRCPIDGLPAGNCVHFPGPQVATDPETQETVYEEGYGPEAAPRPAYGPDAREGRGRGLEKDR
jgi:hypothetical protein